MTLTFRIAAVAALAVPLSGCGTLWYENEAFSSVESSRERARAKVAHFESGHGLAAAPETAASARRPAKGAGTVEARPKRERTGRQARPGDAARTAYAEEMRTEAPPTRAVPKRDREDAKVAALQAPRPSKRPESDLGTDPAPVVSITPDDRSTPSVSAAASTVTEAPRHDPSAVPPPEPSATPRATATQIRDAIFRAWNGVMPTEVSSMALFGVNPYSDGRFADRGSRITAPESVIDRRSE